MTKRNVLTFLVVVILGAMLTLSVAGGRRFLLVNQMMATVLLPVEDGINSLFHGGDNVREFWRALSELRAKNNQLVRENQKLRQEHINMAAVLRENENLRHLLNYKTAHPSQTLVSAKVVGKNFGDLRDIIYVNAGTNKSVTKDAAVVTENGMVGVVDEVYTNYCRILLLTSANCRVGARIVHAGYDNSGIVHGIHETEDILVMEHIPKDAKVAEGDLVVTNSYSGKHPENICIGRLSSVQMDVSGLTQEADVVPVEDMAGLEYVLIVTDFSPKLVTNAAGGRTK